jgi:hypothetical protein
LWAARRSTITTLVMMVGSPRATPPPTSGRRGRRSNVAARMCRGPGVVGRGRM